MNPIHDGQPEREPDMNSEPGSQGRHHSHDSDTGDQEVKSEDISNKESKERCPVVRQQCGEFSPTRQGDVSTECPASTSKVDTADAEEPRALETAPALSIRRPSRTNGLGIMRRESLKGSKEKKLVIRGHQSFKQKKPHRRERKSQTSSFMEDNEEEKHGSPWCIGELKPNISDIWLREAFEEVTQDTEGRLPKDRIHQLLKEFFQDVSHEDDAAVAASLSVPDIVAMNGESDLPHSTETAKYDESRVDIDFFMNQAAATIRGLRHSSLSSRIYATFDDPSSSRTAKGLCVLIIFLIVLSSFCFVLETMPQFQSQPCETCEPKPSETFWHIEIMCITIFTIEYLGRLCTAHGLDAVVEDVSLEIGEDGELKEHVHRHQASALSKTRHFVLDTMNIVDLMAILPFYLEVFTSTGGESGDGNAEQVEALRVLRLARIIRIFKLGKYNKGMQMFGRVMTNSLPILNFLSFFFFLKVVIFGSMIFFAESGTYFSPDDECPHLTDNNDGVVTLCGAQYPEGVYLREDLSGLGYEETPFRSIPHSFWWVVVTSTTVGYGDLYPTSFPGKLVGTLTMICGIVVLALPITVISANFAKEYGIMCSNKNADEDDDRVPSSTEEPLPGAFGSPLPSLREDNELRGIEMQNLPIISEESSSSPAAVAEALHECVKGMGREGDSLGKEVTRIAASLSAATVDDVDCLLKQAVFLAGTPALTKAEGVALRRGVLQLALQCKCMQ